MLILKHSNLLDLRENTFDESHESNLDATPSDISNQDLRISIRCMINTLLMLVSQVFFHDFDYSYVIFDNNYHEVPKVKKTLISYFVDVHISPWINSFYQRMF